MIRCKVVIDMKPLERLRSALRRRIIKKAVTAANKIPLKVTKETVPVLTGALKGVIAAKVYAKSMSFSGIIGPKNQGMKKGKIPNFYAKKTDIIYSWVHHSLANSQDQWRTILTTEMRSEIERHR